LKTGKTIRTITGEILIIQEIVRQASLPVKAKSSREAGFTLDMSTNDIDAGFSAYHKG